MRKKVVIIVGPTASGKTVLSLRIAKIREIEIVSADSRQIYCSMNIGTAKPTKEERAKVIHHCIDIKNPDDFFNAGEYCRISRKIVDEIILRNHLPVVVGGSGLYVRALVDGVFIGNYRNMDVRNKFKQIVTEKGVSAVYQILQEVDPIASKKIHQNDHKRIIRALEVYTLSGVPISSLQKAKTIAADFVPQFWGRVLPTFCLSTYALSTQLRSTAELLFLCLSSIQKNVYGCCQLGYFVLNNVPEDIIIDTEIYMGQHIPKSGGFPPFYVRQLSSKVLADVFCSFPYDLQITDDGIISPCISYQAGFGQACSELQYLLAAFGDVLQIHHFIT